MPRVYNSKNLKLISKKYPELKRFLPCFFDVPLRMALEILGLSHHTLDPIRRSLGLERWPFAEMVRGKFYMNGVKWQREDVCALRNEMLPDADQEMQRALCLTTTRSDECWAPTNKKQKVAELILPPPITSAPPPLPEAPSVWGDSAPDAISDAEFWEEIARMFSLQVAALQYESSEPAAVL